MSTTVTPALSDAIQTLDEAAAHANRRRHALAAQVAHLRMTMMLALGCLDDADVTSPDARRLVAEAKRIMRIALKAEGE